MRSVPGYGPLFDVGEDEMEVGLGMFSRNTPN